MKAHWLGFKLVIFKYDQWPRHYYQSAATTWLPSVEAQLHGQAGPWGGGSGVGGPGWTLGAAARCRKPALGCKWLGAAGCSCCPHSRVVLRGGFACVKPAFPEAVSDSFFPFPCLTALGCDL